MRGRLEDSRRVLFAGKIGTHDQPTHAVADQVDFRIVQIPNCGSKSVCHVLDGWSAIERAGAKEGHLYTFALKPLFEFAKVVCGGEIFRLAEKMIAVDQNNRWPRLTQNDTQSSEKKN